MSAYSTAYISFSGISVRFVFPDGAVLPEEFTALKSDAVPSVDEEIKIKLIDCPLHVQGLPCLHSSSSQEIYETDSGILIVCAPLTAKDGCQVAFLMSKDGKHTLYYPFSAWKHYSSPLRCFHLISGERLLLRHNAFLLHSSVVEFNKQAVVFCGASGIGKSTQALLWQEHLGADIINGDRCAVMNRNKIIYGGGSPWAGTSGIYRKEQYPVAGIFVLGRSSENRIERLGMQAFLSLFPQVTVNPWDKDFMLNVTELVSDVCTSVPVYRLDCRPDRSAVLLAAETLFGKDCLLWKAKEPLK